ncbi:MAG: sulfatase [Elusimicrobia bacterium]|nr:sulfatase [Elusimicrobiota bacterium]
MIVVDILRADHLGCYGYHRDTSPHIDALAKEGTLFTQAFSPVPAGPLSMYSIFTSLYPPVFQSNGGSPKRFATLPKILKKEAYVTALFGGPTGPLIGQDFDTDSPGVGAGFAAPYINEKAIAWLRTNSKKRFFLYLNYTDAHNPYTPPRPYDKLFSRGGVDERFKKLPGNILFYFHDDFPREIVDEAVSRLPSYLKKHPRALEYVISQYDGEIKYVDDQIGVLLDEMKGLRLLDDTLIIVTSDHADEFLEHGELFHGNHLYDETMHVPFIVRLPGIIPKNKLIDKVVRSIDIMPTILDILDIHPGITIQGISLMPLVNHDVDLNLNAYSETKRHPPSAMQRGDIAIRTARWKFISTRDPKADTYGYELYDVKSDPKESINLVEREPEVARELKKELTGWLDDCQKVASPPKAQP